MTSVARKVKVSVSIDAKVLALVDRSADDEGTGRSAIVERWLREASRRARLASLEDATAEYYESLTPGERAEDAALASASSRAARRLTIDAPTSRRRKS